MNKPVLVVLAAGMGSRYHGLKQIDPMGKYGEKILDYSVYDAKRAGFETVVFVIKPQMEQEFEEQVGKRMRRFAPTDLLPDLELRNGAIAVDREMATSLPGVFAAGDCTGGPLQVAKAVGEGHTAGLSAAEYVDRKRNEHQ